MQQETINHCLCADWLNVFEKKTGLIFWFHPPNGGKRDKREAATLLRMGARAGVADLWIMTRHKPLVVELKIAESVLRKSQNQCKESMEKLGYHVHSIHSDNPFETLAKLKALVFRYCGIYPEEYTKFDFWDCLPTWKKSYLAYQNPISSHSAK